MKKITFTLIIVSVWLAACAQAAPAPTPTPTPQDLLTRAAEAVAAMQSAQFTLTREGAPVVFDPQTQATYTEVSGAYQAPDKMSASVKITLFGNVAEIQILWLPDGNLMTNPLTGQFGPAPDSVSQLAVSALFTPSGLPSVLKDGIQNATLVGTEKIEDRDTYHLKGDADGAQLATLTNGALAAGTSYPVDVWMETATSNLVRVHITEPDDNGWLIELFDINQPVEIKKP